MSPLLRDVPIIQKTYAVCHPDSGQSVAYDDGGLPFCQLPELREDFRLGFGIEGAGGLVHNYNLGIPDERPGQSHLLPLSYAQIRAVIEPFS